MHDRRWTYFVFQGLLTVIVLLFFYYRREAIPAWQAKFSLLAMAFLGSLLALRAAGPERLASFQAQAALFVADALLASLTLVWTEQPRSEIYLTYFLIIFGTALTRNLKHSFLIACVASAAYVMTAWDPGLGAAQDSGFWLRLVFLWVMASFAAVLSIDARRERLDSERTHAARLGQMEQLALIGRLSGEVAHGIKGPLTTILVNADVLLQRHAGTPGVAAELRQIQDEVARCRDVLQDLLDLGRIEEMDYALLDLRQPVRGALESMASRFAVRRVGVATAGFEPPYPVLGDQGLLFEAVYQLLQNAEQAVAEGGRVSVALRAVSKRPWWSPDAGMRRDFFELEVADDGRGIDPRHLPRLFDPFFTTKGRDGSGLGLSSALRILHKHSGTLEAFSDGPGKGARLVMTLPRFQQAA